MYTYAIGDIHGRYDLLVKLLDKIYLLNGSQPCRIVFLGDYVDRGPDSNRVIQRLMDGGRPQDEEICLLGNHEDMMISSFDRAEDLGIWLANGGIETLNSYYSGFNGDEFKSHVEFLRSLPVYYEDDHRYYVHAGLLPGLGPELNVNETMVWIREKFLRSNQPWDKHVVHGHTPIWENKAMNQIETLPYRTNVDTGAVWTGVLSAAIFKTDEPGLKGVLHT